MGADTRGDPSAVELSCGCATCRGVEKVGTSEIALVSGESSAADEGTGSVAPGGSASGVINTSGDVDHFTISLVAGQTYLISLAGSGASPLADSFLQLLTAGGTLVAQDDDGGVGTNSLLTFTATTSGTYQIAAAAYPGSGLTGGYTIDVRQMGSDSVGSTTGTAQSISVGQTVYGFVEASRDVDMYKVTLTAGAFYSFDLAGGADYNTSPNSVPRGELDTRISIYDSAGNLVASNDDVAYPDDLSSSLTFSPQAGGTYYIKVDAYPNQTGGYRLDVKEIDLAALDPLDSIDWGTQLPSTNVTVYFAPSGETFDGVRSLGWTAYEIEQAMEALQTWAAVSNLNFSITNNSSTATFKLVTTQSNQFLGYFHPPGTTNAGVGVFATNGTGWNTSGGLEPGGYGWITLVHEFGHGLGLAHPHDNGGTSTVMPGVTSPFDSYGVFDLNQGVYTTMSYNDGWQLHPNGASPSLNYGYQGGPGAFDIALIQAKYGAASANTGDNVYVLPTANAAGTFWRVIWDTGGNDTIAHTGTVAARIDLTAATLDYSPTGAGVISYVSGIFGGFTIAAGVVIENASGGSGADVLIGNSANNILVGGAGNDTLQGNGGIDRFIFEFGDGQDVITDLEAGETVEVRGYASAQSVTQNGSNVVVVLSASDRITFQNTTVAVVQAALFFPDAAPSGPTEGDDVLTGTEGDDVIDGLGGNDTINGLGGNDTLSGGAGNDTLHGGAGDDVLNGGPGDDAMAGGSGNDLYYVNSAGDSVTENADEGYDTVRSAVSWTLGANVEKLELTGSANLTGTGNELDNALFGNGGANVLYGLGGDDFLNGRGGNDTLHGGAGNDVMSAIDGDDIMYGGTGDDIYHVNSAGDVTIELAGEGIDKVVSSISWTLAAEIEDLDLTGGNVNGTGNALDNRITGSSGANVLWGLGGNDLLNGGAGADTMHGGTGNDTYVVDNAGDLVVENAGEGHDKVISSISYTLAANVEDIELTGFANIDATGNALDNSMIGNSKANVLWGLGGNDVLNGGGGADTLYGGEGNDLLYGGAGNDTMLGGTGDDIYSVANPGDVVIENAGEGYDTVISSVSWTLGANVEKLELTGSANLTGTGNGLDNALFGNSGANVLYGLGGNDFLNGRGGNDILVGGAGADQLVGGAGNDIFAFASLADSTLAAPDLIHDFAAGDRIDLSAIDANTSLAGDQAFAFIGSGAFTGTAGELRYETIGSTTYVSGDTNGDGTADFLISLAGSHNLTLGDFIV